MCTLKKIIWAILFGKNRQYSTWNLPKRMTEIHMVMVNFLASVVRKLICNDLC